MNKTILSISFVLFFFVSCNFQDKKDGKLSPKNISVEQLINEIPTNKIEVIVYDGCEYVIYKKDKDSNSSYSFMAHKGNCSNSIHQCK
jgi:ATP-dependent Zn protease